MLSNKNPLLPLLLTAVAAIPLLAVETPLRDLRGNPDPHTKTHFVPRHYPSSRAWREQRALVRQRILTSAGLWPMPSRSAVRTVGFGEVARQGYTVEKLLVETLPGFYVGANVYRPQTRGARRPGVLIAHGHWKNGRIEHTKAYSVPALGAALARNGYVALAYDMVGYNDTRQVPHKFGDSQEEQEWSYGPFGLQLWNSIRILDYLSARPDVDSKRLAITGASGGGTQTYFLAAVDDRIRVSIPVDMLSANFQGDDPCEMAPGLRIGTNNLEVAAAMAPRPMLIMSSAQDWTSEVPKLEFPAVKEIYNLMRAGNRVELFHTDAEHGYNAAQRSAAVAFLGKHFRMPAAAPVDNDFKSPPEEFLIGPDAAGALPGALDRDGVFQAWQKMMTARSDAMTPAQRLQLLQMLTGVPWPSRVEFVASKGNGFLHRDGYDDVVPAKLQPGNASQSVIAIHGEGAPAALEMKPVQEAAAAGAQILSVNLFATGPAPKTPSARRGDYLVFHYADDANRVQDVVTAASWLAGKGTTKSRLLCGNGAAELCRLAAALVPVKLELGPPSAEPRKLFIPGLRAAGFPTGPAQAR